MPYAAPSAKKPHNPLWKRQDRARYDLYRLPAQERGYDANWRKVRLQHLADHPLCEDCLKAGKYTAAQDVHHRIKISVRPDLRDVTTNLCSLCRSCHNVYTQKGE